ncbi:MAG: PD-(D/E)XK nuclease family protein, partial [Treponemataceae bacterium]
SFYRLLQRAKRVRLLYNKQSSDVTSGEMSRYLRQLKIESGHDVQERELTYNISIAPPRPIIIEKDADIQQQLNKFIPSHASTSTYASALSASSINNYISCPLKFYFAKIAKIREPEHLNDIIANTDLGNIYHNTMEYLYTPLRNAMSTKDVFKALSHPTKIEELVSQITAEVCLGSKENIEEVKSSGKLWLLQKSVVKFVLNTLNYDAKRAPFTILDTEMAMKDFKISVNIGGTLQEVSISGIIDRIDITAGEVCRVIDYKTGANNNNKMHLNSIASLFEESQSTHRPEILQLLLYGLYLHKVEQYSQIDAQIYFARSLAKNGANAISQKDGTWKPLDNIVPLLSEFEEHLKIKLSELFDISVPFKQCSDIKSCEYCAYASICRR